MKSIDLNCDVGEGIGLESEIIPLVSSVNIACGAHAGDRSIMAGVMDLAREYGVSVGAHPGFADRENFGRREIQLEDADLRKLLLEQLEELSSVGHFAYVKPHGALYTMAANDARIARVVVATVREFDANLWLMGLAGSAGLKIAADSGVKTVAEAFADRCYDDAGRLVSRKNSNAVITSTDEVVNQVLNFVREGRVDPIDGPPVSMRADSICLHGDNPKASELARSIREALISADVSVRSFVNPS